jgi:hypothetical protein
MNEVNLQDKIAHLLSDKQAFEEYVYTETKDAIQALNERQNNSILTHFITGNTSPLVPKQLMEGANILLCRNIASPNYEMFRFLQFADVHNDLRPLVLEYINDKYVSRNTLKKALVEIHFCLRRENDGVPITKRCNYECIDVYEGISIGSIRTNTDKLLHDLHRDLFLKVFPNMKPNVIELSQFYSSLGGSAVKYYRGFLSLLLQHNIMLENFVFSESEKFFLERIFLPNFIKIHEETGQKPLIIHMGPAGNEDDDFWLLYPPHIEEHMNS